MGLALLVGAGMALDRWAPPQDLPWKPFSLDRPIGWATHVQLARIAYDPAACQAALAAGDVDFAAAPPLVEGDCHVLDGGRLGEGTALLKPAAPLMMSNDVSLATRSDRGGTGASASSSRAGSSQRSAKWVKA